MTARLIFITETAVHDSLVKIPELPVVGDIFHMYGTYGSVTAVYWEETPSESASDPYPVIQPVISVSA